MFEHLDVDVGEGREESGRVVLLGQRRGEIFGLSPDDVDFLRGVVEVQRQSKQAGAGRLVFALPKGGKTRTVPLPNIVRDELAAHLATFAAREVTLPWGGVDGPPTTVRLAITKPDGAVVRSSSFHDVAWRNALRAAGVPLARQNGCHALRHHFASVLLDGGESIKALSEYLGHSDPGFTLRTYTHLMPSSHERTRRAVDTAWSRVTGVSTETG